MVGTAYPFVVAYLKGLLDQDSQILEIGCGGRQYKPLIPGRYYGLDLPSSPYLEEPPDFACSAEAIPCDDERFDLVFGVATFLIIPDVVRVFSECRRVLKAGSRLVVFDYQKRICRRLQVADETHRHVWNFQGMRRRLEQAGFGSGDVKDVTMKALRNDVSTPLSTLCRLAYAAGYKGTWLIVEAQKQTEP